MSAAAPERAIVVWIPDWPVVAYLRTQARELSAGDRVAPDEAIAVFHANTVIACNAVARAEGIARGQRRRDAQSICPALRIVRADEGRDQRAFHDALSVLEELSPGAEPLRPGLAALRARGPARFYRGEEAAATALLGALSTAGFPQARAGVADGLFTAEHAARSAPPVSSGRPIVVIPPGRAGDFLAPLPVSVLGDPDIAILLTQLGIRTLGDFAGLAPSDVRVRLGEHGVRLRALAAGADSRAVTPRVPPARLAREIALEPPLEMADQIAFAVRQAAEAFDDAVAGEGLIATAIRITLESELGGRSERIWQHPEHFDAAAVVDRVRWQLESAARHGEGGGSALPGGVCRVLIEPEAVDDATSHQPTLIGQGPGERSHHALTRIQTTLGHEGVVTPVLAGGRFLAEREVLIPWGDARQPVRERSRPWPGSLPAPLPSEVFRHPRSARVHAAEGAEVRVNERGILTAPPARIDGRDITDWAGPWPVIERTWDPERSRWAHRFQLIDDEGSAWLAVLEDGAWWLEGRYS